MKFEKDNFTLNFVNSGETARVSARALTDTVVDFLGYRAHRPLVDSRFLETIGNGNASDRFSNLLNAAGYPGDPDGFFKDLLEQLEKANPRNADPVTVNGISLPNTLLVCVLEKIVPGNKLFSIKKVEELEKIANMRFPEKDRAAIQEVIDTYPVRLSQHTIRQMAVSRHVAYQYLPFVEELENVGHVNTWIGQFHQGLLEQMYRNRVIYLLNMTCPVYCRFCFRKHKESRNQAHPTVDDVKVAAAHTAKCPDIKELVLTGGDPFLNADNMKCAVEELSRIDHVQTLRLATRSIAYYPRLFHANDGAWMDYLKMKSLELKAKQKRLEVATHFIHPDEISPESLEIISDLVKGGVSVYVQTPFLNGCNDEGPELTTLFGALRGAGAEMHYIYIPCSPIHGNSVYWSPISKGLDVGKYLRAHLSDRAIPRICTATPIGKMDWHTSGWAVEQDRENENFIWIRSPYTPAYFDKFAPLTSRLDVLRLNAEGTFDVRYMARIGDPSLFQGRRGPGRRVEKTTDLDGLKAARKMMEWSGAMADGCVETGLALLRRVHETRVELDVRAGEPELDYIRSNPKITDVVIALDEDASEGLFKIDGIVRALEDIGTVNAVRLKSRNFNHSPETFTPGLIEKLARLNRLTVANPLRLEIETWYLHANEISPASVKLAGELHGKGITVYANTPLLAGINDSPGEINRLAYGLRAAGIEFHHVYAAGTPIQRQWNRDRPVDVQDVLDIATKVRREGSGREIPRYIVATSLGEVDFGLSSAFAGGREDMVLSLSPYSLEYYRAMDPGFSWPDGVDAGKNGAPCVEVPGLTNSTGFLMRQG